MQQFIGQQFRAPKVPFPVIVPYEVKADLGKLDTDPFSPNLLVFDRCATAYRKAKLEVLNRHELGAAQGFLSTPTPAQIQCFQNWILQIKERLSCEELTRAYAQIDEPARAWINAQPVWSQPWHELGLALQDDWVLMVQNTGTQTNSTWRGALAARLMHVCFPTGWDPSEKYSRDLGEIHQPVSDGDRLRKSSTALGMAMAQKGPFVRYVWTLAAAEQLSQHPLLKVHPSDQQQTLGRQLTTQDIFFRCERQVTVPLRLDEQSNCPAASLFLIRVFVAPLSQVLNESLPQDNRRETLRDALQSMTEQTIEYKGLRGLIEPLGASLTTE